MCSTFIWSAVRTPQVRVRVAHSLKEINIVGKNLQRYLYPEKSMRIFKGKKRVKFNCNNLFKSKKRKRKPILLAHLSSSTGFLDLGKDKFKGKLLVATSPKGDSCDVIHQIDLENYLPPLLSKEMHGSWPIEALKAQAVAARTYAAYKMKTKEVSKIKGHEAYYDIENSERHQVSGTYHDATGRTKKAQRQTHGQVLVSKSNNRIYPIFFHAESGARTLLPEEVWDNPVRDYFSVKMPYQKSSIRWNSKIHLHRIKDFFNWYLNKSGDPMLESMINTSEVRVVPDKVSRYVLRVYLGDQAYVIRKTLFRKYFGRKYFKSNSFKVSLNASILTVEGHGSGHGVGMSQIGAKRLAEKGWSYRRILSYYYPGYRLKKIY